jgi:hypothetical protein
MDRATVVCRCMYMYIHTDIYIYVYCIVYLYNRILLSPRKGDPAICHNLDEPREHYANWNKPDIEKKYCMLTLICEILRSQIYTNRE